MTDKDRLLQIVAKAKKKTKEAKSDIERNMIFVDELLANGVIVPACDFEKTIYRVGEKRIYGNWELMYIQVYPDEILYIDDSDNYFTAEDIGKTVFLTKEEAEAELKKRGKENG